MSKKSVPKLAKKLQNGEEAEFEGFPLVSVLNYTAGLTFAASYELIWKINDIHPSLTTGLLLGATHGSLIMLSCGYFDVKVPKKVFLLFAHLIFGVSFTALRNTINDILFRQANDLYSCSSTFIK